MGEANRHSQFQLAQVERSVEKELRTRACNAVHVCSLQLGYKLRGKETFSSHLLFPALFMHFTWGLLGFFWLVGWLLLAFFGLFLV